MTSSTNYSDVNVRPRRYRGIRSSKKSILYSDYNAEEETKNESLGQRSVSLTALPHNGTNSAAATTPTSTPGPLLEPRMAQLETLEAKMASIEVSLSTTPRRKSGKKNGCTVASNNISKTSPSSVNIFSSVRSNALTDTCRELEILRNALKDKENTIQNLRGQMNCCGRLTYLQPLDSSEKRTAELRLQSLKQEEESRKSAIKKINLTLEKIDANEANIDIRIKQAELEYELGREELELLGVREEMRTLQARLDAKPIPTLYSCVNSSGKYALYCVQLEYDPKSPRFGAGNVDDKTGLFVSWAAENSGLQKGDRILEVNGKLTLSTSKEEMTRLLTVCPSKAEIVVCRIWSPSPSNEEFLRRENLRLTHRISYLEDQVSELLILKESSLLQNKDSKYSKNQTEVFQKGSQVALLSAMSKGLIKSNNTLYSNSLIRSSRDEQEKYDENMTLTKSSPNISKDCKISIHKRPEDEKYQKISMKPGSNEEKIKNHTKKYEKEEYFSVLTKSRWKKEYEKDDCEKKCFNYSSSNGPAQENLYSLSDLDKHSRKSGSHHTRNVDYSSETSYHKYTPLKERKVKSVDGEDVETKLKQNVNSETEFQNKPSPPKKPIRLSINRATSLQNVETGYALHNAIRKVKRSHKGEAPQPPSNQENKLGDNSDSQYIMSDSSCSQISSKIESWRTSREERLNFRWASNYNSNKSTDNEKWC